MSRLYNSEQKKAIDHLEGPSLIVAGAGSGKTYVLTEKVKKIILEKKTDPQNVLALTFTEKAAAEMEERVDQALPYGYFQSWIMTFHSFADHILRDYGVHIGINPAFKIITQVDATMFFRTNLAKFDLKYFYSTGNPTGFIRAALEHFSRLRDENISAREYLDYARRKLKAATDGAGREEAERALELAGMYRDYEKMKLENNYLDFSDLIFYLVKLLRERPSVKRALQKQFKYCLVDEFQDTNIVQYDLLKLLFPPEKKPNLTVIGDDNQSIYKFRGASVSNILNFMTDYSQAAMFVLNTNYRSRQEILDSSYRLIQNNNPDTLEVKMGISKRLVAARGSDKEARPRLLAALDADQEAENVVAEIKKLAGKKKYRFNDIAVLVRANEHAKPVIQALERYGIPFQFLGPALLYYKSEIRNLIAVLKFIMDPNDSTSLYRILSMNVFGLHQKDILLMTSFSRRLSRSLFETVDLLAADLTGHGDTELRPVRSALPTLSPAAKDALVKAYGVLENMLKKSGRSSAIQTLFDFLDRSGYLKTLSEIKSKRDEDRVNNITRFFNKLKKMEGETGEVSVFEAINNINLSLEIGDSPSAEDYDFERQDAVNILTVHSAKGLEFPVVFLVGLCSDRFPNRFRKELLPIPEELIKETLPEGDFHLEEERRLFYVGLTRSRDRLYLSFADFYGGGKRKRKASPFILETVTAEELAKVIAKKEAGISQLSIFDLSAKKKPDEGTPKTPQDYGIRKYSFSQIEVFEKCPKQYEFRYLIRIPEPDSPALSFGSSIHAALELFYRDVRNNLDPGREELLKHFRDSFIPFGYVSAKHRNSAYRHGEELLTKYLEVFHNSRGEVVDLEKNFVLKLENGIKRYVVSGKIDRIDRQGDVYEIIDYKTGKMPPKSELKRSLQLGIYALAAVDRGILNIPLDKLVLTYYYLDKGEKFSLEARTKDLDGVREHVLTTLAEIEEGGFEPKTGIHCDWCPFKIVCPAWES